MQGVLALERLAKDVFVVVVYEVPFRFLGREPDAFRLQVCNSVLLVAVASLEMEKLCVGITFPQESDSGAVSRDSA